MTTGSERGFHLHATAVSCGCDGILIVGPSRAGKSRLAADLIASASQPRPIALVGDDRIRIAHRNDRWMMSGHWRIAGFMERRGLGLVAVPYVRHAVLRGVIDLGRHDPTRDGAQAQVEAGATSRSQLPQNLQCLSLVDVHQSPERLRLALHWLDNFARSADEQV